jgi:hypothetical protein
MEVEPELPASTLLMLARCAARTQKGQPQATIVKLWRKNECKVIGDWWKT